jgi:CheY-like chemotaxis protein
VRNRLAIIDDDDTYLSLLSKMLGEHGYEVRIFNQSADSAEAYESVLAFAPDLIVLDIAMDSPGRGWKTLNLLKLDPLLGSKPVVVCSNDLRRLQEGTWYLKAKGCEVLPKPYYLDDLLAVLSGIEIDRLS